MADAPESTTPAPSGKLLETETRSAQVLELLARILQSPSFQGSRRSQDLLRYCVTNQLAGDTAALKERVIGAQLFGRKPDYDTSSDAIVRVKANEVRKRLAQYYDQADLEDALRIDLPAGSYAPVISWVKRPVGAADVPVSTAVSNQPVLAMTPSERPTAARFGGLHRLLAARLLLPLAGVALWLQLRPAPPMDRFWRPVLASGKQVLVCVPARDRLFLPTSVMRQLAEDDGPAGGIADIKVQRPDFHIVPHGQMSVQNFRATLGIASFLEQHRRSAQVRLVSEASLDEIRQGGVILVGAYHNPWAMELNRGLRFDFESANEGSREVCWIRDRDRKGEPRWIVRVLWPYGSQPMDYAIISRTFAPENGQVMISLAGVNGFGTQAAAEFLTVPRYWHDFERLAGSDWERRNVQIVLETRVVREMPSPPKIAAVHVW